MQRTPDARQSFLARLLGKHPLDQECMSAGRDAALSDNSTGRVTPNPHEIGTIQFKSWQKGYDAADDWTYVW